MAALVSTALSANAVATSATVNTLTASDTLTYNGLNKVQILEVSNATGGSLDVLLLGDNVATFTIPGYGTIDPTAGFTMTVADGETRSIILSGIDKFIKDSDASIAVTGGTDATAIIYDVA